MQNLGKAIGACAFGLLIMASPAAAQSGVELSAGYNLLITEDDSVPVGWYLDVAKSVSGNIGVVGQVTGNYKSEEEAGVDIDLNLHTFLAGVRFSGANTSTTPTPIRPRMKPIAALLGSVDRIVRCFKGHAFSPPPNEQSIVSGDSRCQMPDTPCFRP